MELLNELNGEKGSFILELRTNLNWNHTAFVNLMIKLYRESLKTKKDKTLEREIASGVWFISTFIKSFTSHKDFPKKYSLEYYSKAYELINDITWTYFMVDSPFNSEIDVQNELKALEKVL